MKNKIFLLFLTFAIALLVYVNYILPLVNLFFHINYNYRLYQYFFIIATYLCVALLIWIEKTNLEEFHIDRLSLAILIIFGFFRYHYGFPGENYFLIPIYILSFVLLLTLIVNFRKIPPIRPKWILISIFTCFLVIPLAFIASFKPEITFDPTLISKGFLWNVSTNTFYNISFISPFEEVIFRGILWGQLRKWGWSDKKIIWVQAIFFWLLHIWEFFLLRPFTFLVILPIAIVIESILVFYSRRVYSSILFHNVGDVFIPIIVQFYV